jgi:diguanylate cyclase (GGDEF)-like protein
MSLVDRMVRAWSGTGPAGASIDDRGRRLDAVTPATTDGMVFVLDQFEQWAGRIGASSNPWPEFGELVRSSLHQLCGATRVTPYRVTSNGKELRALRDGDSPVQTDRVNTRKGLIGHVFTTGRTYVKSDAANGELIESLAGDGEQGRLAWCFVVRRGNQRIGLVTAGHFADSARAQLPLAERLISLFWQTTGDVERARRLEQSDPVCGLPSRPAFLETAEGALAETYRQNAPSAVAVLAVEGLRSMNDSGRWEVADDLLRDVSRFLQSRVRNEDRLGRFDGSRFVLLLRGVDSELATLIVRQIMAQMGTLCGDTGRWGASLKVRCGLSGSGSGQPSLRDLVSAALRQVQLSREQNRQISSDILAPLEAGTTA